MHIAIILYCVLKVVFICQIIGSLPIPTPTIFQLKRQVSSSNQVSTGLLRAPHAVINFYKKFITACWCTLSIYLIAVIEAMS